MNKTIQRIKERGDKLIELVEKNREYSGRLMKKSDILLKLDLDFNDSTILWSYLKEHGFTIERFTVRCPTYQAHEQTPVSE